MKKPSGMVHWLVVGAIACLLMGVPLVATLIANWSP
jgi:hypothetical protein